MRPLLGFGVAMVLAAAAVAACVMTGREREPDWSGPPVDVPLAADKSLGVNVDLSRYPAGGRESALVQIEAAGFRWIRQRFSWDAIEPQPGEFRWAVWDEIVEAAERHNLGVIAVLDGSPSWARAEEDKENSLAPPCETRDYGAFVAAFARRYGQSVDYYQMWDEPNIAPHWGARWVDPAAYLRLLREGAIQVRAADPGAHVLLAALAPTLERGGANMSDLAFLESLYQQGAAEWFDVVAGQPYDFGESPATTAMIDRLNWKRLALVRRLMEQHGDGESAVWAVSFGLAGGDERGDDIGAAILQARQDWPWLGPMLWAAWAPEQVHGQYALVNGKDAPTAALDALRSLGLGSDVAYPGVYPADHGSGRYLGMWRITPFGADIGQSGDRLEIRFWGSRLDLVLRRGEFRSFLYVAVDGQPANALPRDDEGRAYAVLYDPLHEVGSVTMARGLQEGYHTAEIVADRGWGQWAIKGWRVSVERPIALPWLGLSLGAAALGALGGGLYWAWPVRRCVLEHGRRAAARYRLVDDRLALAVSALCAILVFVSVGTLPSLAALALLSVSLLLRPETGLYLIAFALPFYQLGKPLLGKVFSMVEILTLLTVLSWAVDRVAQRAFRMGRWSEKHAPGQIAGEHPTALDWGVVALAGIGVVSLLWTKELRVAARELRTVVLEACLFYALLRSMLQDRRRVWLLADVWVLGGAAIAVLGLVQWGLGRGLITTAEGVGRVRGLYGSPNNLALYLGRLLPLGVAITVWGKATRRRWAYGVAVAAMAVAILLTHSRGAWLLGVPASVLFLFAVRRRRAVWIVLGVLLLSGALAVAAGGGPRLLALLDGDRGTTFFRVQLWKSSLAMVRDHPLGGVGLDNFLYQYRTRYVLPTAWEEFNLSHPHNLVLDFWLSLGLPGLGLLAWMLVMFFRQGWRMYRSRGQVDALLALGAMGGIVDMVAHGLVDQAFFLTDLAFAFMVMLFLATVRTGSVELVPSGEDK